MSVVPFIVSKKGNEDETGIAVSEHVLIIPDPVSEQNPSGFRLKAIVGVLWDDNRVPSPSYHDPSDLAWIAVPGVTDDDEEEDEDEDEEEEI